MITRGFFKSSLKDYDGFNKEYVFRIFSSTLDTYPTYIDPVTNMFVFVNEKEDI